MKNELKGESGKLVKEWALSHLEALSKIKNQNGLGECFDIAEDLMSEFPLELNPKMICIYNIKKGDLLNTFPSSSWDAFSLPLFDLTIMENKNPTEYLIHFAVLLNEMIVIDLCSVKTVDDQLTFLYNIDDYRELIDNLNESRGNHHNGTVSTEFMSK